VKNPLEALAAALARRLLGISAEEIRYTFEDVRSEIRAVRGELKGEIAELRRELEAARKSGEDRPKGMEIPVAEA
jgi:ribosome recycling factor